MRRFIKWIWLHLVSEKRVEAVKTVYPGKSNAEIREMLAETIGRRLTATLLCTFLLSGLIVLVARLKPTNKEKPVFYREEVNGGSRWEQLVLTDETGDFPIEILIHPVLLTEDEIDSMHAEVCVRLDAILSSDGTFSTAGDIALPETIEGYPVEILWSTENTLLVSQSGEVHNSELSVPKDVGLIARISYGDEFRIYERTITVLPPQRSESEQKVFEASERIKKLEGEKLWEKVVAFPDEVLGFSIALPEKERVPATGVCVLLTVFALMYVYYSFFSHLEEQKKKKMRAADEEYKDFVSRLSLLLSAGLTVRTSVNRLSKEYLKKPEGLLSRNLEITVSEIENGEPECQAYERFGERMGSVRYKRLSSVLCQAVTKGVKHIEDVMIRENEEATAEEKEAIRIRGENAGTKLLFPMMGFLIIVFAILLVPAFRLF